MEKMFVIAFSSIVKIFFYPFRDTLLCRLHTVSVWTTVKFCHEVKHLKAIMKNTFTIVGKFLKVHNPLPHVPILDSSNSAPNKDMMLKIWTNGDTVF